MDSGIGGIGPLGSGGFASAVGGTPSSGGQFGSGGSFGSGGALASGGSFGSGGALASGGSFGSGGAQASGGSPGSGGSTSSAKSDMPAAGAGGQAKPAGALSNFKVLNWAGFKAAVSFSFDDALSSQISNYSTLDAVGIPLTFYVVSSNNASSSTWAKARSDGHEIGNHTAHHCHDNGTGCAWGTYAGSLGAEFDQCTSHIENDLGQSAVWTSASPYGDGGYATPAASRFLLNRGVNGGQIGPNDGTNAYALPCQTAGASQMAGTFNSATESARSAGKWQIFLIHSLGGDGGYNPISVTELTSAMNYAKGKGDVWPDSVVHVGAYWVAQKMFTALTPATSGSQKTWTWSLPAHFPPGRFLRVHVDGGTLQQGGQTLTWDEHGYYEVSLDAGSLTWGP